MRRGKYKHYKGNVYIVLGIAEHAETGEKLVVYSPESNSNSYWARPVTMFEEEVLNAAGKTVLRFECLEKPDNFRY